MTIYLMSGWVLDTYGMRLSNAREYQLSRALGVEMERDGVTVRVRLHDVPRCVLDIRAAQEAHKWVMSNWELLIYLANPRESKA